MVTYTEDGQQHQHQMSSAPGHDDPSYHHHVSFVSYNDIIKSDNDGILWNIVILNIHFLHRMNTSHVI